jgi:glycosyltransferase involved in cell wall biosynthesis
MRIAFVWDNFGPLHDDRLRACVQHFSSRAEVLGIEINGKSDVYSWVNDRDGALPKVTLFPDQGLSDVSDIAMFRAVAACVLRRKIDTVFLCHYERSGTAMLAYVLRALGRRVYVMGCPKFDDRPRNSAKEFLKRLFLQPYMGALVGGPQTRDYLAFLGLGRRPMVHGYNTVSNARVRALAAAASPTEASFETRDFLIIARLVEKKNLGVAIEAFARYLAAHPTSQRRLAICGDGPLEGALRALAEHLGVGDRVVFHGFLQSEEVAKLLVQALAMLLVSTEEQFGNVVAEALALDIPVILSDVCGARYELLRTGENGFLVEPDNIAGLAYYMGLMSEDEGLWRRLRQGAADLAPRGDVARFAQGVEALIG